MTKFYFEEDGNIIVIEEGHEMFNSDESFNIEDMEEILSCGFWN